MAKQTKKEAATKLAAAKKEAVRKVTAAEDVYRKSPRTLADWRKFMAVVCNKA
jgi:hypothetical protein